MYLSKITNPDHPYLSAIQPLYEDSFPLPERRTWSHFLKVMADEKVTLHAIVKDEQFAGFVVWWQLEGWFYIEHLALQVSQRGKGLGTALIKDSIARSHNRLVLETESPVNEQSIKRINFYQYAGLHKMPFAYFQPTYRRGDSSLEMILMTSTPSMEEPEFKTLTELIRTAVYDRWRGEALH